jgi:hypothetical protein
MIWKWVRVQDSLSNIHNIPEGTNLALTFLPNPERQILLPTQLVTDLRDYLEGDVFGAVYSVEIDIVIKKYDAFKSKGTT